MTLSEAFVNHDAVPDQPRPYYSTLDAKDANSEIRKYPGDTVEQHHKERSSNMVTQSGFPDREYVTSVSTQSGAVSGTFPLGTRTGLVSRSGSLTNIELLVMPANVTGPRRLSTISRDGSQSVRIVEDDFGAGKKEAWWEGMLSNHESQSGSINVEYPDSWNGLIEVETESGSVSISGRGVDIIREERGRVVARKGEEGHGKVIAKSGSGKVDLRFG